MATPAEIIAYRLDAHHLTQRLPVAAMLDVAGACGIQDTAPGSAETALYARLDGLAPSSLHRALTEEKSLLRTLSVRGATYLFPTRDSSVFTSGAAPESEEEIRFFIQPALTGLQAVGMTFTELVERCDLALQRNLAAKALTRDALGRAMGDAIAADLPAKQADHWRQPSAYAPSQFLGESLARFALAVLGLRGRFCYAPRKGATEFRLTDEWLAKPLPPGDPEVARVELARRYLRCYGPSTVESFAAWAGIAPSQAANGWAPLQPSLTPVDVGGRRAYLHEEDLERFQSPQVAHGVRLLPAYDPYLLGRDREILVPERTVQRLIWRYSGNPGAVLVAGALTGIWRAQKQGRRLNLTVQSFSPLAASARESIEAEAVGLLPLRGCQHLVLAFSE